MGYGKVPQSSPDKPNYCFRIALVLCLMGTLLVAVTLGLCAYAFRMYEALDMGRSIHNHRPGECRQVQGPVKGSEDIEFIRSQEIAFITSGVLYLQPHRNKYFEGKMFIYDFKNQSTDQPVATQLPIKGDLFDKENFHPHGLTHWMVDYAIRLYVINHNKDMEHSVEVFEYDHSGADLLHRESIKHPTLVRPNDLVTVGPDQFIFTNDGVFQSEIGTLFEALTGWNGGTVYYWDGKESHLLLSGMGGPNGIAYDGKRNKLFVVEMKKKVIHAYELPEDKKSVVHLSTIDVHSACDNIYLDEGGILYAACHPLLYEVTKSVGDCDGPTTSPSQVLRLQFDEEYKTAAISELYANDGKEISASSVAVFYNNQMLIGSICKGLLHCEIRDSSVFNF